jgi:GT2 family glycosyltransferase
MKISKKITGVLNNEIAIAVLLTCHNRKEKTLCCLRNLFACSLPENCELHVYLVDDGSTDGTAKGIKDNFPMVKVIQGDGNLFWNRGMNLAWKIAAKEQDYDFYLWINDDTNLYSNALTELLETSQIKNNKSIICGSTCATNYKEHITYSGRNYKDYRSIILLIPNGEIQECDSFNGNIALIPKYIFEKIGFNDAYFRHYFGDSDYGLRAKKNGLKIFISPNVLGECDNHDSWGAWANQERFYSRWKTLHSPKGPYPKEQLYFNMRHFGLLPTIYNFIRYTCVQLLIFPKLRKWIKRILRKAS